MKKFIWWLRYRTTEKYHVVKTGLKPGYYDTDHIMIHACFNLLKEFVETEIVHMYYILCFKGKKPWWKSTKKFIKEHQREFIDGYLDYWLNKDNWKDATEDDMSIYITKDQEIKTLYYWWIDERPKIIQKIEHAYFNYESNIKSIMELEEKAWKEDEEMLIRLMKIRPTLWT